jgi:hypothetical protein
MMGGKRIDLTGAGKFFAVLLETSEEGKKLGVRVMRGRVGGRHADGFGVTWSGGDPNGHGEIKVSSATDNTGNNNALAFSKAPTSAGTFTIPSNVLLALLAG